MLPLAIVVLDITEFAKLKAYSHQELHQELLCAGFEEENVGWCKIKGWRAENNASLPGSL